MNLSITSLKKLLSAVVFPLLVIFVLFTPFGLGNVKGEGVFLCVRKTHKKRGDVLFNLVYFDTIL